MSNQLPWDSRAGILEKLNCLYNHLSHTCRGFCKTSVETSSSNKLFCSLSLFRHCACLDRCLDVNPTVLCWMSMSGKYPTVLCWMTMADNIRLYYDIKGSAISILSRVNTSFCNTICIRFRTKKPEVCGNVLPHNVFGTAQRLYERLI